VNALTTTSSSSSTAAERKSLDATQRDDGVFSISGLKLVSLDAAPTGSTVINGGVVYIAHKTMKGGVQLIGSIERSLLQRIVRSSQSPLLTTLTSSPDVILSEHSVRGLKFFVEILNAFSDWEDATQGPALDMRSSFHMTNQASLSPFYDRLAPIMLATRDNNDLYQLMKVGEWSGCDIARQSCTQLVRKALWVSNKLTDVKERIHHSKTGIIDLFARDAPSWARTKVLRLVPSDVSKEEESENTTKQQGLQLERKVKTTEQQEEDENPSSTKNILAGMRERARQARRRG
jgi:hypothetical protein